MSTMSRTTWSRRSACAGSIWPSAWRRRRRHGVADLLGRRDDPREKDLLLGGRLGQVSLQIEAFGDFRGHDDHVRLVRVEPLQNAPDVAEVAGIAHGDDDPAGFGESAA